MWTDQKIIYVSVLCLILLVNAAAGCTNSDQCGTSGALVNCCGGACSARWSTQCLTGATAQKGCATNEIYTAYHSSPHKKCRPSSESFSVISCSNTDGTDVNTAFPCSCGTSVCTDTTGGICFASSNTCSWDCVNGWAYVGCFPGSSYPSERVYFGHSAGTKFNYIAGKAEASSSKFIGFSRHVSLANAHTFDAPPSTEVAEILRGICQTPCLDDTTRFCGCSNQAYRGFGGPSDAGCSSFNPRASDPSNKNEVHAVYKNCKSCTPTGNVANSNKATAGSITGTTGQTVNVTCNTGYTGGGTATCSMGGTFNALACSANTCTCPNGTPTIATGSGASLCDTATVDCSVCDAGYTISATAVSGSAQTCNVDSCTATYVLNSDKATANTISGT